jgi:hypothetical protein
MAANPSEAMSPAPPFSDEEVRLLRRIADAVIPPSIEYDVPGAGDAEIFARVLARSAKSERTVRDALAAFAGEPAERAATLALGDAEFGERLRMFVTGRPAFAALMSWLVAAAYYQDARVLRSIGMEPRPPFPQGHVAPPSDWSLLEPVKRRGKIYRDVPRG